MKTPLAQRLRAARQAIKPEVTQRDVAKRLGVSPSAVNLWEADKTEPSAYNLGELSKWYGVSVDWLLGVADSKTSGAIKTADSAGEINTVPIVGINSLARWNWDTVAGAVQSLDFYPANTAAAMTVGTDVVSSVCPIGSTVVVSKGHAAEPGQVVLAVIGSSTEPVLRRLVRDGGVDMLMADDTRYPTVRLDDGARIIGVVTEVVIRKKLVA